MDKCYDDPKDVYATLEEIANDYSYIVDALYSAEYKIDRLEHAIRGQCRYCKYGRSLTPETNNTCNYYIQEKGHDSGRHLAGCKHWEFFTDTRGEEKGDE